MFLFVAEVMAQEAAAGAPAGNPLFQFVPIILIFAVFYFLIIRPQQKKQKSHQGMLDALKKGDRIVTSGGLHGSIQKIHEGTITLEIADKVKVEMDRAQVARLVEEKA